MKVEHNPEFKGTIRAAGVFQNSEMFSFIGFELLVEKYFMDYNRILYIHIVPFLPSKFTRT